MTTEVLPTAPPEAFYRRGAAIQSGAPGTLVDAVALDAPAGTRAWAVLYRTRSSSDRTAPVSGLVLAPVEAPPPTGYPTVAWAHGTTGIADRCAPSRDGVIGTGLPGLVDLARSGYLVTATDYEGLGTTGLHPYLVGASEGHSVLDSIRAARAVSGSDAKAPAVLLGISQGGHAALWASELAARYAPEIDLVGTVAASPPIDLRLLQAEVFAKDASPRPESWLEGLMVVSAWHDVYGLSIDGLLSGEGMRAVEALRDDCPSNVGAPTSFPFRVDPSSRPDWLSKLTENSPGHHASSAPILVLAARGDEQVPPATIQPGVDRLCAAGSRVELRWVDGEHTATLTSMEGISAAIGWIRDRLDGKRPTGSC
jgi:hypothetical protein